MSFFASRKRRNEELRVKGVTVYSFFLPDETFFRDHLTLYLAEMTVAFSSGDIQTLNEAETQVEALQAMPPVQRVLCSASILHAAGKPLREASVPGGYFCDLVLIAGIGGCVHCAQDVLDREDRDQARLLVRALGVLAGFAHGLSRAQAIYFQGHLTYGVLDGPTSGFANALRQALTELELETSPRLAEARAAQRSLWTTMLGELDRSSGGG